MPAVNIYLSLFEFILMCVWIFESDAFYMSVMQVYKVCLRYLSYWQGNKLCLVVLLTTSCQYSMRLGGLASYRPFSTHFQPCNSCTKSVMGQLLSDLATLVGIFDHLILSVLWTKFVLKFCFFSVKTMEYNQSYCGIVPFWWNTVAKY